MPNPISHPSKSGTARIWADSSVMRYPESERPSGISYSSTNDDYITSTYNSNKSTLDDFLEGFYKADAFLADLEDFSDVSAAGGYMQCGDGWYRIWDNSHWRRVYAGENPGVDDAYRPVWEASGFCLRWDSLTEDMLDYDPEAPELVRFKGDDVSLLSGRQFSIGGSRTAYRKFIRWCETAPKPVEVRKDMISSPNEFRVDWIAPKRIDAVYRDELNPLHMISQGSVVNNDKRHFTIDTSVMVPPSPFIYMVFKPVPDPETNRFVTPSDPSKSDRWKSNVLFQMRNSSKITESEITDFALNAYLIIPPDADPAALEANDWQDCSVGFIFCGSERTVKIKKKVSLYDAAAPGVKETAIIVIMSRGRASDIYKKRIYANAISLDYNYVSGEYGWIDSAVSVVFPSVALNYTAWQNVNWNYDASMFEPVLNYATKAGDPGFNPCVALFNGYNFYQIRMHEFFVDGIMKNEQEILYRLQPWYNGEYMIRDVERGDGGMFIGNLTNTPGLLTGPAVPDVSLYRKHRIDLTDASTHHYLSKNDLNVIEGTAVTQRTVWNVIRDSLRLKLQRGTLISGQYIDNLWEKYAWGYNITSPDYDWKLVYNTNNPLYTVNGQPGCEKVFHIEKVFGENGSQLSMKIIPIEDSAYNLSVCARGNNKKFWLTVITYSTRALAENEGSRAGSVTQEFTATSNWERYSVTILRTSGVYANIYITYKPGTEYASGDYMEICAPSFVPGTAAQWVPAKGDTYPLPPAGASAYSPDSSSWGDYYQMVRMPNIWCAPYDRDGRHEFWISIADECPPGMIPWFVNQDERGEWVPSGRYKLISRYPVRSPQSRSISPDPIQPDPEGDSLGSYLPYPSMHSWKLSGVDIARGSGPLGPMCNWMVPNCFISGDEYWDNSPRLDYSLPVYMTAINGDLEGNFSYDIAGFGRLWSNWENSYAIQKGPDNSPQTYTFSHLKTATDNANLYIMSYWEYHVYNMIKTAYYGGHPRFDKFLPGTMFAYGDMSGWRAVAALHLRELGQADWTGCLNVDGSLGDTYTEGTGIGYIRDYGFQEFNHNINNTYSDSFKSVTRSVSSVADARLAGVNLFMWVEELGSDIQLNTAGIGANCVAAQDFGEYSDTPAFMIIPANIAASRSVWDPDTSLGRNFIYKTSKSLQKPGLRHRSITDIDAWGWPSLLVDSWAETERLNGTIRYWTAAKIEKFDWQASFGTASCTYPTSGSAGAQEFNSYFHWGVITHGNGFHKDNPIMSPWSSKLFGSKAETVNGGTNTVFCTLDCITEDDLPYDYEVDWLESDGNQWIDTEISDDCDGGKLAFECRFWNSLTVKSGNGTVFGAKNGSQEYLLSAADGGTVSIGENSKVTNLSFSPAPVASIAINKICKVSYDGDQTVSVNGGSGMTVSFTAISLPARIYLFCVNNNGTVTAKEAVRIYYARFGENGHRGDFIPVVRDGAGYMYNKITGKLHGNKGPGFFKIGPRTVK